ncbi:hypothetical protein I6A81_19055 [Frankia sp. CN7]|uniref:Uncharacterized protein n=1 Tax=Frankia nepalensis TaxID=1836974 RepID=A0A937USD0_9ACTN|nr:hypothetical protein [Frankia nepalensis]MBL7498303.1 hypothetical protein [Frankia nepalensis]MBL7509105.1 hypothetical protein [Frankia nepalensis]MBL7630150.1 hypothetical protein [Frankia nepalensis]
MQGTQVGDAGAGGEVCQLGGRGVEGGAVGGGEVDQGGVGEFGVTGGQFGVALVEGVVGGGQMGGDADPVAVADLECKLDGRGVLVEAAP